MHDQRQVGRRGQPLVGQVSGLLEGGGEHLGAGGRRRRKRCPGHRGLGHGSEHPTAPRFGVPDSTLPSPVPDAASVAHRLLSDPVRAAFQGKQLLEPISGPH